MTDLREQGISTFEPRGKPLNGLRLRQIREASGLSQVDLALNAGLQPSQLDLLEQDLISTIEDGQARNIAQELDVAPEEIFNSVGRAIEFIERNPGVLSLHQEARTQLSKPDLTPSQKLSTIVVFLSGVLGDGIAMEDPLAADFVKQVTPKIGG